MELFYIMVVVDIQLYAFIKTQGTVCHTEWILL